MSNSDQKEKQKDTNSLEAAPLDTWSPATTIEEKEKVLSATGVDSTPFIGTIIASSKDDVKRVTVNPNRIEKAIETLKKNKDIERRGL